MRKKERCRYFEESKAVTSSFLQLLKLYDERLYRHAVSVADYCEKIAFILNLEREKIELLRIGAYLHDIGRILGEGEEHVKRGVEILKPLNLLSFIYPFIYSHHERINGKGFPERMLEASFSTELKILTLVDEYVSLLEEVGDRKEVLLIIKQKVLEGAFDEIVYNSLCQVLEDEDFRKNLGVFS